MKLRFVMTSYDFLGLLTYFVCNLQGRSKRRFPVKFLNGKSRTSYEFRGFYNDFNRIRLET